MRTATLLALLPLAMASPSKRANAAPIIAPRDAQLIDGKYIVKMKDNVMSAALHTAIHTAVSNIKADADYVYNHFGGFAASLDADEIEALQNDPNVEYIEQDAIVTTQATQNNADWGLARISNNGPGGTTYTYDDSAGEGACAYVVDTGIDVSHPDFEGRATFLANFADSDDTDGNGHGTHCAGTIAGAKYGVAKKAKLYAVKVLGSDGSGTNSGVIQGMEFVVSDAPQRDCPAGVVVNMSLGGGSSSAVNTAAREITGAGIFLGVAAGNEGADASTSSPASEPSVCTVGATDKDDTFAYYSNYGSLVDILAPGTDIESDWLNGQVNTISGTSMATPHVVGLAAYFLGLGQSVDGLCDYIASQAQEGAISSVPSGTVNKIIQNGQS